MSSTANDRVAEALSEKKALGDRSNWFGNNEVDTDDPQDPDDRPDPNDPNEIVAYKFLLDHATMNCRSTLEDEPTLGDCEGLEYEQRLTAQLFASLDGETWGKYATHDENKAVELTDPCIRLGQTDTDASVVGEWGTERHRKRINPETGYITGDETTSIAVEQFDLATFMELTEMWLRDQQRELREAEIQDALNLARGLKKNTEQNKKNDVEILGMVVDRVR
jgi:hypothetical protein